MCPTTKDGAAFLSEAHTILGEFRSMFAALPASSALRQPCKWPGSDETIDSWLSLLERVLDEGLPTLGGDRFDRSVYGLSSEPANGLRIQRVGEQPTFFGSYPPPDDLDGQCIGQCIDLVAIAATDAAPVRVTARPRLRLQENMASFAEIRAMQNSQQDNTTLGSARSRRVQASSLTGATVRWRNRSTRRWSSLIMCPSPLSCTAESATSPCSQ